MTRVRDGLIEAASRRRSLIEQSERNGGMPMQDGELAEIRAINAAADCFQYVLTFVQREKIKKKGNLQRGDLPQWVNDFVGQARNALREE